MPRLTTAIEYSWQPLTINGEHFCFRRHGRERLVRDRCSHWGPVIYRWEGALDRGPNAGKRGVLVGETGDLRARLKQYATGTQDKGNQYWREQFLDIGDVYLSVLSLERFEVSHDGNALVIPPQTVLDHRNPRLIVEQVLVLQEVRACDPDVWVVNKVD